MFLTDNEKRMLDGEEGYPAQKAMQILSRLGEIYGAERMIPVTRVHMPGASSVVAGQAGTRLVEKMADEGGHFRANTTLNTGAVDFQQWGDLGYSTEAFEQQQRLTKAYEKLGANPIHTCTPYLIGYDPAFGEHVAWGESSAIAFVNSVIGARTNREGGPSALASALTGLVPDYGLHRDENRGAHVHVHVEVPLVSITDFGSLGYWVGQKTGAKVPCFTGIEAANRDQLKMLGAALASSGSVALFHVVGITPEAPSLEKVFAGKPPPESYSFNAAGMEETANRLNKHQGQEISIVVIGCPHASVTEVQAVAKALEGRHLAKDVDLWVTVSQPVRDISDKSGASKVIEQAGGRMVNFTCPILSPFAQVVQKRGYKSLVTNSAKLAHYSPGQWAMPTYYASLEDCVQAGINGKF